MFGIYDRWKTQESDPGRGNGRLDRMTLTCAGCTWSRRGLALAIVSEAEAHAAATGHAILYKGVVQQFSPRRSVK